MTHLEIKRLYLKRRQVLALLGPALYKDAQEAGWIMPVTRKPPKKNSKRKTNSAVFYRPEDIEKLKERMDAGEYPTPPEEVSPWEALHEPNKTK